MTHSAQVMDWLASQKGEMLALLEELVNLDSGSYDKAGVDRVGERLASFFESHGIPVSRQANESFGDIFSATVASSGGSNAPVVLMGHRDTVFPKGEAKRRPFRIVDDRAYGPGVADMKGGLVMNAFVAAAFHKFGGAPAPIVVLTTSDEEIGSLTCRPTIEEVARNARAVFNSEPGRPTGNVVTGRKGAVFMACTVTGKSAHSGAAFQNGISAVNEIAHKIVHLEDISDLEAGVTLNVGLVSGGQSVNTVAPSARIEIDLRYVRPDQRDAAMARIEGIVQKQYVAGTQSALTITGEFAPLVQSRSSAELLSAYQQAMTSVGERVEGEFSGGCADSGFTSLVGCPTICAVGPVGGFPHTPEEYLEVDSLVPRAQGLALTISQMA